MSNHRSRINPEWVVSGQNLLTGEVVYLALSGWISSLATARVFDDEGEIVSTIGALQGPDRSVLSPDKLLVSRRADGRPSADHFREVFRATGPSNRFHGKQAAEAEVHHV